MTGEEIFLERKEKRHYQLYSEKEVELPEVVRSFVSVFRRMCAEGGRIPVPVVVIAPDSDEGAATNSLVEQGRGIKLQVLRIQSRGVLLGLQSWCDYCKFSEMESIIRLAAHEARHCLQRRHIVSCSRDDQWLSKQLSLWLDGKLRFSYFGDLFHDSGGRRGHVESSFSWEAPSRELRKKSARELDTEATAIAAAACWRAKQDMPTVIRLVHG